MKSISAQLEHFADRRLQRLLTYSGVTLSLLATVLSVAWFTSYTIADPDLWTRFAVGKLIVESGWFPSIDPFAFTLTKTEWHDHELLHGLWCYLLWIGLGAPGLWFLKIGLCFLTTLFIRKAQEASNQKDGMAVVLLMVSVLGSSLIWISTIRAHVFTFMFFAVFLLAFQLYRFQNKPLLLKLLPLVTIIWVNTHGGFVTGLGFFGVFTLVQMYEHRTIVPRVLPYFILCVVAPLVNPYGVSFISFIGQAVTITPNWVATNPPHVIPEWLPIQFDSPTFFLLTGLLIGSLIGSLIGIYRQPRSIPAEGVIFLLLSFYFGIKHTRFHPFFLFTVAAYAGPALSQTYHLMTSKMKSFHMMLPRALTMILMISVIVSMGRISFFLSHHRGFPLDTTGYPVKEIEWLMNHRPDGGRILTHYNDGSYVLWAVWKKFLISLDGRFDGVFPLATMDESLAAISCRNAQHETALTKLNPDYVLLGEDTIPQLQPGCFPGFREILRSQSFIILEKELQPFARST